MEPQKEAVATEWKHANCTLVNKMRRQGVFQQAVLWCDLHQEFVESVPL